MSDKLLLLDMDGVICEFNDAAYKVHGGAAPAEPQWGIWDDLGITEDEFWAKIGHDFWANLPWTEEGEALLAGIERLVPKANVALLTSPSFNGGIDGKWEWVRKHMPDYTHRFIPTTAKHFVAGPGKILVDDRNENVDRWVERGGLGVLVPRTWNRRRHETKARRFDVDQVLAEIERALNV